MPEKGEVQVVLRVIDESSETLKRIAGQAEQTNKKLEKVKGATVKAPKTPKADNGEKSEYSSSKTEKTKESPATIFKKGTDALGKLLKGNTSGLLDISSILGGMGGQIGALAGSIGAAIPYIGTAIAAIKVGTVVTKEGIKSERAEALLKARYGEVNGAVMYGDAVTTSVALGREQLEVASAYNAFGKSGASGAQMKKLAVLADKMARYSDSGDYMEAVEALSSALQVRSAGALSVITGINDLMMSQYNVNGALKSLDINTFLDGMNKVMNASGMTDAGYDILSGTTGAMFDGIKSGLKNLWTGFSRNFVDSLFGNPLDRLNDNLLRATNTIENIENVNEVGRIGHAIKIEDKDLEFLTKYAERKYVNQINLTTQAANVTIPVTNNGAERLSAQTIVDTLNKALRDQMQGHTDAFYAVGT